MALREALQTDLALVAMVGTPRGAPESLRLRAARRQVQPVEPVPVMNAPAPPGDLLRVIPNQVQAAGHRRETVARGLETADLQPVDQVQETVVPIPEMMAVDQRPDRDLAMPGRRAATPVRAVPARPSVVRDPLGRARRPVGAILAERVPAPTTALYVAVQRDAIQPGLRIDPAGKKDRPSRHLELGVG